MDRPIWAGSLFLCFLFVGCSKSQQDAATARPSDNAAAQTMSAPAMSAPAMSAPAMSAAPFNSAPPTMSAPAGEESFAAEPPAAVPPAPTEPAAAAAQQPRAAPDFAGNPLRPNFEPPTVSPGNPLRSRFSAEPPAAAAPPLDFSSSAASPPAGGAALPFEPQPLAVAPAAPASAAPDLPAAASHPAIGEPFDVVEVFYGTDRRTAEPGADDWRSWLVRFAPSGAAFLLTACLGVTALVRRSFAICLLTLAGLSCTAGLGFQASAATLAALRRLGTTGPRYTTARAASGHVDLGICEVSIPRTHDPGEVESPSITRLEIMPDAMKHVVLRKTERVADARFHELLRERVAASDRKEMFVFIHGFNVSFEDAARRTAQIHYDLKFPGAPVFFSWPANDKFIFSYPADETNVAWSVPHLKKFLLDIVEHSGAQSINLIAHSMGNRALTAALREIDLELRGQSRLFNQVILAAPDIDAEDFRHNIAPAMQRTARQLTLYASSRDDALLASQLVHRGPRAGDAGAGLVVVQGIDTIDVTAIDSSPWGHSYYGSSDPVLNDLRELFARAVPPRDRSWLSPAQRDGLTYWVFQAARTAANEEARNR